MFHGVHALSPEPCPRNRLSPSWRPSGNSQTSNTVPGAREKCKVSGLTDNQDQISGACALMACRHFGVRTQQRDRSEQNPGAVPQQTPCVLRQLWNFLFPTFKTSGSKMFLLKLQHRYLSSESYGQTPCLRISLLGHPGPWASKGRVTHGPEMSFQV